MTGEFKYKGRRYAYKSLGDGPWTPDCATLELMKVLRRYFISVGKMKKGGSWPGSHWHTAWTRDVFSPGTHAELDSNGRVDHDCYYGDGHYYARFAVIPQDSENKKFIKEAINYDR